MLTGDVAELDADGVLRVVGRKADFIIRGGKNVSARAGGGRGRRRHPGVALAAAVAMPDPVFGERVCVYVELRPGRTLTLRRAGRRTSRARELGRESLPERLVVLPRAAARLRREDREGGRCARTSSQRVAEETR